jgi:hypothetical protein
VRYRSSVRRIGLVAALPLAVLLFAGCSSSATTAPTTASSGSTISSPTSANVVPGQTPSPCSPPHANYRPVQGTEELVAVPKPGVSDQTAGTYTFDLEMSDGRYVVGGVSGGAAPPSLWLERGITQNQLTYLVDKLKESGLFVAVTEQLRS